MGKMHQFVGGYNARKINEERERERIFKIKTKACNELKARRNEIAELVRVTFWAVDKHNRRKPSTMAKAYGTAERLARIGGEDYQEAVKVLRFAMTGPEAYADACAAMLVGIND